MLAYRFISLTLVVLSAVSTAQAHKKGHKHSHGAHVHGEAQLSVAFDGLVGKMDFRAPTEAIYGFEHVPKTEKEKTAVDESLKMFESHVDSMVQFPVGLNCRFAKEKLEVTRKGKHADLIGLFGIECEKSPAGSSLSIGFHEHFQKIKVLKVTIVVDALQKSVDLRETSTVQLQ